MHKNCSLFPNKSLSSNPVKIHIPYKKPLSRPDVADTDTPRQVQDKIYKDIALR